MPLYKVYMTILAKRIEEDSENKRIIPRNQTGFRKKMGTIDNVYVFNYLIYKQLGIGKKLVLMFVDLRAAFDTVDRTVLYETIKERGIREGLIRRIKEFLRETRSRVKAGRGEVEECFWMERKVRQECPLSPILFNLLIADLEEVMGKFKWGGVKLGGKRIYMQTIYVIGRRGG